MDWKADILAQLAARDRRQRDPFEDVVAAHHALLEKADVLDAENKQLRFNYERLKVEAAAGGGSAEAAANAAEVAELRAKLLKLQEELTDLHRRKGENAQQVIDLSAAAKDLERQLGEKTAMLLRAEQELEAAKEAMERLKGDVSELEKTNQLLKDEYQTLQLALTSAERKRDDALKENARLLEHVIELKEKEVAWMNAENDSFQQRKQEQVSQQIAEAVKEYRVVVEKPAG